MQKGGDGHGLESTLLQTRCFCVELRASVGQSRGSFVIDSISAAAVAMTRPRLWCFPASTYHFLGEQDHRKSFAMNRETSWMKGKQFTGLAGHRCARPLARGPFVGLWQRSALASRRRCSVEFGECLVNAFCFQTRSSRVHHKSLSVAGFLYFRMSRSSGGSCARETS